MKKILVSLLFLSLIFPLAAQGALDAPKLQELGAKMIDKRVNAISKYDGLLVQTKHISEATLTQVRGELSRVGGENGELNTLKTKILGETDIPTLKADIKLIVEKYRVYQVFLPQSVGIVAVDRLKAFQQKLYDLKGKISLKADELEGQGKDVSAIRNLLSTADGQIGLAATDISTAEIKFVSMQISDPETARSLKLEGRQSLLDARKDFSDARKNLKDAVQQIKELAK